MPLSKNRPPSRKPQACANGFARNFGGGSAPLAKAPAGERPSQPVEDKKALTRAVPHNVNQLTETGRIRQLDAKSRRAPLRVRSSGRSGAKKSRLPQATVGEADRPPSRAVITKTKRRRATTHRGDGAAWRCGAVAGHRRLVAYVSGRGNVMAFVRFTASDRLAAGADASPTFSAPSPWR